MEDIKEVEDIKTEDISDKESQDEKENKIDPIGTILFRMEKKDGTLSELSCELILRNSSGGYDLLKATQGNSMLNLVKDCKDKMKELYGEDSGVEVSIGSLLVDVMTSNEKSEFMNSLSNELSYMRDSYESVLNDGVIEFNEQQNSELKSAIKTLDKVLDKISKK